MFGSSPALRVVLLPSICALACALTGCGRDAHDPGALVPVSGKVTVDGAPLLLEGETTGSVSFRPDAAKGNNTPHEPLGVIDKTGNYKLSTAGKAGAPPGWYKIAVGVGKPVPYEKQFEPRAQFVNKKYELVGTSGLVIEVVNKPEPDAYDLKLTK